MKSILDVTGIEEAKNAPVQVNIGGVLEELVGKDRLSEAFGLLGPVSDFEIEAVERFAPGMEPAPAGVIAPLKGTTRDPATLRAMKFVQKLPHAVIGVTISDAASDELLSVSLFAEQADGAYWPIEFQSVQAK